VNAGAGAVEFDTPMSAIETLRGSALSAFSPTGVTDTTIWLPGTMMFCAGAVTANVARPSALVVTDSCDGVPPTTTTVNRCPALGRLSGSRDVTVRMDCELPSRGSWSGEAVNETDDPRPDGPISGGGA